MKWSFEEFKDYHTSTGIVYNFVNEHSPLTSMTATKDTRAKSGKE